MCKLDEAFQLVHFICEACEIFKSAERGNIVCHHAVQSHRAALGFATLSLPLPTVTVGVMTLTCTFRQGSKRSTCSPKSQHEIEEIACYEEKKRERKKTSNPGYVPRQDKEFACQKKENKNQGVWSHACTSWPKLTRQRVTMHT